MSESFSIVRVKVTPKAKQARIVAEDDGEPLLKVYVTVAPEDGKANRAVQRALAEHFSVARTKVKLISGQTSRDKRFRIG
jgi:uncharacterized protein (TIGR00251 family)